MIDFGYELIKSVFDGIGTSSSFRWVNYSVKFLAIAFFLLNLYGSFLDNIAKDWGVMDLPFNFSKTVTAFMIIIVIAGFDQLLILFENLFVPLNNMIDDYNPLVASLIELEPDQAVEEEQSWTAKLIETFTDVSLVLKYPYFLIAKALYFVLWIVDNVVYGIFLVERFFALTVLRLVGPFVFALAVFEKLRDLMFKWLKLYAAFYLLIIPYFLVIYITNEIYDSLSQGFISAAPVQLSGLFLVGAMVAVGISLWLKLRLFKKSTELIYKVFA
ncbi:hypothetical protein MTsPCn9_34240 [Croceitalea sp. MTPC9]|uniref:type IV secretion system protein n=1 Tax=unclassified Croceitalea TaxID=2632280 RepID=UPI002B365D25|nr:hypothetical protein MTsPCn6_34710 [Croceitalea sp. MTPC6]GMN18484.1 hypothetical protein MTsPCn9_34240 [Croceitalea sp. MTPC9]